MNDREPDRFLDAVDAQRTTQRARHAMGAQPDAGSERPPAARGRTVEAAFGIPEPDIPEPGASERASNDDQAARLPRAEGRDLPEAPGGYDDFMAPGNWPADSGTGLVSLAFIKTAIRRGARLWCATAAVGFLMGFGLTVLHPTPYQASTSVLLTYGPYENAATASLDAQAIAQSRAVAGLAVHRLGLAESSSSFLSAYSAIPVSNRVLVITTSAPSSNDAVSWANATAAAFLQFRAGQLQTQQELVTRSLDQQISQAKGTVSTISKQIRLQSAQPASPQRQAKLGLLQAQRTQAASTLSVLLQQAASRGQITSATALAIKDSKVLDTAAPLKFTGKKHKILYAAAGLIMGLVLGMGIVVVMALASDRLRRRDDVAYALGAPVKLSVGAVRLRRWLPGRHGLAAARLTSIQRIVTFLRAATPEPFDSAAALAVIPSDDPQVAALSVVSLAVSFAREGRHVVLVDLVSGAPAASLVGSRKPGIQEVRVQDAHLVVVVPEPGSAVPAGPRHQGSQHADQPPPQKLVAASASADLLLTLAALDPSLGGEHLPTWADDAVVFVTAGRSSATRIHAVGEMIRLAGMASLSAVLVGADKDDDSLGLTYAPGSPASAGTGGLGAMGR